MVVVAAEVGSRIASGSGIVGTANKTCLVEVGVTTAEGLKEVVVGAVTGTDAGERAAVGGFVVDEATADDIAPIIFSTSILNCDPVIFLTSPFSP